MGSMQHEIVDEMMISEVLDSMNVNTGQHASSPCDIPYPEGGGDAGSHGGEFSGHHSHHHNHHHQHHHQHHNQAIDTLDHSMPVYHEPLSTTDHLDPHGFSADHFTGDPADHVLGHVIHPGGHGRPMDNGVATASSAAAVALQLPQCDVIPLHCDTVDLDNELPLSSLIYYSTLNTGLDNGDSSKMNFMEGSSSLSPPMSGMDSPKVNAGQQAVNSCQTPAHASPVPGHPSQARGVSANGIPISSPSSLAMFQLGSPHHPVGEPLFLSASATATTPATTPATTTATSTTDNSPTSTLATPTSTATGGGANGRGQKNNSTMADFSCWDQPSSTSNIPELPSSTVTVKTERKGANIEGKLCQICCDSASGFHYGVWSCEGCKAFFKRSLQASHLGPVDYICPATNTCKIDKHRRKSCQACRLRKCLEMGMSKGNSRKDKNGVRQQRQNRRANIKLSTSGINDVPQQTPHSSQQPPQSSQQLPHSAQPQPKQSSLYSGSSNHSFDLRKLIKGETSSTSPSQCSASTLAPKHPPQHPPQQPPQHPPQQNDSPQHLFISNTSGADNAGLVCMHPMVEHLLRIDPPIRMTGHDNKQPDTELNLVSSIIKLADLELIDIINWAKAINGYADLNLKDRVHLLEMCWTEVIVCGLVWRSTPVTQHNLLIFAPDLHFNRERCFISKFWPICGRLANLCNLFRKYKINNEEFVLIRTMILLNSGMSVLEGQTQWTQIQKQVNDAFYYTVVTRYGGDAQRVIQLLLLLPHIRSIGCDVLHWLLRVKQERGPLLCDLLHEMIDANHKKIHR